MLQKSENVTEDMIAILSHIQRYVPDNGCPLFLGGDQLTVERARNAILAVSDSTTASDRCHNLHAKIEDWHALGNMMQVSSTTKYTVPVMGVRSMD